MCEGININCIFAGSPRPPAIDNLESEQCFATLFVTAGAENASNPRKRLS